MALALSLSYWRLCIDHALPAPRAYALGIPLVPRPDVGADGAQLAQVCPQFIDLMLSTLQLISVVIHAGTVARSSMGASALPCLLELQAERGVLALEAFDLFVALVGLRTIPRQ